LYDNAAIHHGEVHFLQAHIPAYHVLSRCLHVSTTIPLKPMPSPLTSILSIVPW